MGSTAAARVFAANEKATAVNMQTLSTALNGIQGHWVNYLPVLTATTTNPTMGPNYTVRSASRWHQIGKTVFYNGWIYVGDTFTAGSGTYLFSLPVPAITSTWGNTRIGWGNCCLGTGPYYHFVPTVSDATHFILHGSTSNGGTLGQVAHNYPVAMPARSHFHWQTIYEAA